MWIFAPNLLISGPVFLLVYALVAVGVIVAARSQMAAADSTVAPSLLAAPVEVDRDPFEIAYLRGGGNELLRFVVFDLIRRGALVLADPEAKNRDTAIVATGAAADESLSSLERDVLKFFAAPHTTKELFASSVPAASATFGAAQYEPHLRREGMLRGAGVPAARSAARVVGLLVLVGLAAYRIEYAILLYHSFGFLIVEAIIAIIALLGFTSSSRLSSYGRSYLNRLATAVRPRSVTPIATGFGMLPIAVAATGFGALAGTEYAPLTNVFPHSSGRESSGSCGYGTYVSSDSGSSGGGGCGGGGCGG
jgi:uncharacterized protein (TIGR04222 family)